MKMIDTELLEIAYEEGGPQQGTPILILHGWPDAPRGWSGVTPHLHAAGFRTLTPYLRGFTPTRFLSEDTPRVGSPVALAQDAIDFADALGIKRFAVLGHDWGARIAYTLAALFPERLTSIATLALGYQPRGVHRVPGFAQSRNFWYQLFMSVDGGAEAVRRDPVGFARILWDTWSPAGWFDEAEFKATAASFTGPDWPAITLNSYRTRWLAKEKTDPRYKGLQKKLEKSAILSTPTLMIQGDSDFCEIPKESDGLDDLFTGGYHREVLTGTGHFPHREAPGQVAEAVLRHFTL